ncbi:unnamed protein product [Caenorhabditis sp. 36 PRJEB53466]|nr:unnamed protein product [Caenorhabditis sp. 36 PRJEB53466]
MKRMLELRNLWRKKPETFESGAEMQWSALSRPRPLHAAMAQEVLARWTVEDDENFLSFLAEHAKTAEKPLNALAVLKEYTENGKTTRDLQAVLDRFRFNLALKVHELKRFDKHTKVRIIYAYGIPVAEHYLIELRKEADVELDERRKMEVYIEKEPGGLKLIGYAASLQFTETEDRQMLHHLARKARESKEPLSMDTLWKDVAPFSKRSCSAYQYRFHMTLRHRIVLTDELDTETKVLMLYCSGTPINGEFLQKLREEADVEVDENGKITKYREKKPNGLELNLKNTVQKYIESRKRSAALAENYDDPSHFAKRQAVAMVGAEVTNRENTPPEMKVKDILEKQSTSAPTNSMQNKWQMHIRSQTKMNWRQSVLSPNDTAATESDVSKKVLLTHFRTLIQEIDHPQMDGTLQKLKDSIRKLKDGDEKMKTGDIRKIMTALNSIHDVFG